MAYLRRRRESSERGNEHASFDFGGNRLGALGISARHSRTVAGQAVMRLGRRDVWAWPCLIGILCMVRGAVMPGLGAIIESCPAGSGTDHSRDPSPLDQRPQGTSRMRAGI